MLSSKRRFNEVPLRDVARALLLGGRVLRTCDDEENQYSVYTRLTAVTMSVRSTPGNGLLS